MNVETITPDKLAMFISGGRLVRNGNYEMDPKYNKHTKYINQATRNNRINDRFARAMARIRSEYPDDYRRVMKTHSKRMKRKMNDPNYNNITESYTNFERANPNRNNNINRRPFPNNNIRNYFGITNYTNKDSQNLEGILTPYDWQYWPWQGTSDVNRIKGAMYNSNYKVPTNKDERLEEYKKALQAAKIYNKNKFNNFKKNATSGDIQNRIKFMDGRMGGILDFKNVRDFFVNKLYTTGNVNFKPSRELAKKILLSNSVFMLDKGEYYNYALNKDGKIPFNIFTKMDHQNVGGAFVSALPKHVDLNKVSFTELSNAKLDDYTRDDLIKAKLKTAKTINNTLLQNLLKTNISNDIKLAVIKRYIEQTNLNSAMLKNVMNSKMNNAIKLEVIKKYVKKFGITKTLNKLENMNMIGKINIYNPVTLNTGNHVLVDNLRFNKQGKVMIHYALNKNTIKTLKNSGKNKSAINRTPGFLKKLNSAQNIRNTMAYLGANTRDPINRNVKLSPVSKKNNREYSAKTFKINGKLRSMGMHENKLKFFEHNSTKGLSCTSLTKKQLLNVVNKLKLATSSSPTESELCIALTKWANKHKNLIVNRDDDKKIRLWKNEHKGDQGFYHEGAWRITNNQILNRISKM